MSAALIETYAPVGDGPRFAVKDCIDIEGARTACGSRAFEGAAPARRHAACVQALVDHGYALVGKASMHELAYGMTGVNAWTGTVDNPRYPGIMPGGSSSGSAAAVAQGLVDIALGTDTGGSVRMPAACCGVIGFKPTFGRVSREGVWPVDTQLDCVGLFTRSVTALERAMVSIDPAFVPAPAPASIRVGLVDVECDQEIAVEVQSWLSRAKVGAEVGIVRVVLPRLEDAFQAGVVRMAAEAHAAYGHLVGEGLLGADVEARLRAAPGLATAQRCEWANHVRDNFCADLASLFERFDVLAMPTLPQFPPPIDDLGPPEAILRLSALVRPFNLSGHPAISLPLAMPSGRPAGVQLVAPAGRDELLCAIARALFDESATSSKKDQT